MKNKQLVCSLDSFFLAVLQHHGPPNIDARHYLHDRFNHGTGAYLKHTEHGKLFMEYVVLFGEAKARAARLYGRYINWYCDCYIRRED
jgi:hypothetical protein